MCKLCNNLLIINGKGNLLATNDDLMSFALCDLKSLKLFWENARCVKFQNVDNLSLKNLKCSKCFISKNNCQNHTEKVRHFERVKYCHKSKEKKKLQLIDKWVTFQESVNLLKSKLKDFSQHRFIVQHTSDVYDQVASSLTDSMLLKIHDFSENYTCLLPEEIQFALDTGETAKLYPIVVL